MVEFKFLEGKGLLIIYLFASYLVQWLSLLIICWINVCSINISWIELDRNHFMMGDTNRCHKRTIHLVIDACFMEFILVIIILYLLATLNSFLPLFPTSLLLCLYSLYFYSHPSLPSHPIDTTIMQALTILCLTVSFSLTSLPPAHFTSYN